ncbi:hypothetical protein NDU88_002368 [Pleurodeles waltl]|uniref:Uncharacterized protein n=1 Tax=Pleurodeles waltl TaxID=8319 RepID=A0AAV7UWZ0_PLEWA|nr:hypothetical protein NDU88_002368 [Pleurodeles waltl]
MRRRLNPNEKELSLGAKHHYSSVYRILSWEPLTTLSAHVKWGEGPRPPGARRGRSGNHLAARAKNRAGFGAQETKTQQDSTNWVQTPTQSSQVSSQEKEQSGTACKATQPDCKHTHSPNRGQPSGQRDPSEDQATSGDSPVRATRPCALALGQGNMENAEDNVELDIEQIIKAAREAASTHSKDRILK